MTLTHVLPQTAAHFAALNIFSPMLSPDSDGASGSRAGLPPLHPPVRYCSARALALGQMADLSYCSRRLIQTTLLEEWGFDSVEFFPIGSTEAFITADSEKIIVAFRGSDGLEDWLHNLKLDLVHDSTQQPSSEPGPKALQSSIDGPMNSLIQGKVHAGFLKMIGAVGQDMRQTIGRLKVQAHWRGKELAVWFTGHSLGAALATLAVAQLRLVNESIQGLYTFASPRVGDRTFAHYFNTDFGFKTFRVVNKNDLIPRTPLRSLGYHHVGQLYYFDRMGQLHPNSRAAFRLLDGLKIHANDLFDLDFSAAENHDIGPYLQMLYQDYQRSISVARQSSGMPRQRL